MRRLVVIGLGFGDEGKGLTTDYLCSRLPGQTIVVRFSGGHQAGHTVMPDPDYKLKHIHSNYGSGSLRNTPTYFSEHTCFFLNTMEREMEALQEKTGMFPSLFIHPLAKVTTPYDVAYNRLKSGDKHDTVGLGVGATMARNINTGYRMYAVDLQCREIAMQKLYAIRNYYMNLLAGTNTRKFEELVDKELDKFVHLLMHPSHPFHISDYNFLHQYRNVIFEGSQGVLLDMDHGVFPHVTYAHTTSKNALEIISKIGGVPEIFYVTRSYLTRHGAGWFPKSIKGDVTLVNTHEEINEFNKWQGDFKVGEIDYHLLNHALRCDRLYHNGYMIEKNLVITCNDQRPGFEFKTELLDAEFTRVLYSDSPYTSDLAARYPDLDIIKQTEYGSR